MITLEYLPELRKLCARHASPSTFHPLMLVSYFELFAGVSPRVAEMYELGAELDEEMIFGWSRYSYAITKENHASKWAGKKIAEIHGSSMPVKTEEIAIFCPKVRKGIETRWKNGRWEKLLKNGWTPA